METLSSILSWEIPWTEELSGLQSTGSQRIGHDLKLSLNAQLIYKVCLSQGYNKVIQLCISMYLSFFRFFSHLRPGKFFRFKNIQEDNILMIAFETLSVQYLRIGQQTLFSSIRRYWFYLFLCNYRKNLHSKIKIVFWCL